uniref:PiggyBac transposable element-derived protein domain-containing protein n=1 Tax=Gouania willdenowi TaxID=441366 RepID=A0A8C5E3K8_GOUWI
MCQAGLSGQRSASAAEDEQRPGPSDDTWHVPPHSRSPKQSTFDQSESDEFSEPDPDSSDKWLPSGLISSSRAASPDAPERHEGELESNVPVDFLELFMTDELLQHVADETNRYAGQYFQLHPESLPHSRGNSWNPVSVGELKTFFGLSFLTGYVKKPSLYLYWSMDEVDATPYFNKTMPKNRFQILCRYLHSKNNESQDASDKMYKVRPVLDYVVQKFKELYQPGRNVCVDEGVMQWRGRLSFRVYNPQKSVKYGIKSYILCDSATGYCFNMRPYVGEASTLSETVLSILDRLPGHGYTLYMDNFYNSVVLCEPLLRAKTNVCGTLRKNRGESKIIRDLTKTWCVMVVAWQDKWLVKMVTTCHQDRMQRVEVWQRGPKTKVPQMKPLCVVAYNSSMNEVDKLDQNIPYYPFVRRSLNWSKKFVAYLFQICICHLQSQKPRGKKAVFSAFCSETEDLCKTCSIQRLIMGERNKPETNCFFLMKEEASIFQNLLSYLSHSHSTKYSMGL